MCGRLFQRYAYDELRQTFGLRGSISNLQPHFNIAPTDPLDVILAGADGRELTRMRWGLVPAWWKKPLRELPATFNARAETVAEKPMYRGAFKARRCIIPASGFYEWKGEKGAKQPYAFTASDGSPVLAFAGLWERSRDPASGEALLSCTIIVSGASAWMTPYHDRMPVLLAPEAVEPWLAGEMGPEALQPAREDALRAWPVSKRVGRAGEGDDDPSLVEPLQETAGPL